MVMRGTAADSTSSVVSRSESRSRWRRWLWSRTRLSSRTSIAAKDSGAPAYAGVPGNGSIEPPLRAAMHRDLAAAARFGWRGRCCGLPSFRKVSAVWLGMASCHGFGCGESSTTNLALLTGTLLTSACKPGFTRVKMLFRGWQQIAARWHRTLQDQSGWLRGLGSSAAGKSGSNLGFMKERSGRSEPPAAERLQCGELVPQGKNQSPKNKLHGSLAALPLEPEPC